MKADWGIVGGGFGIYGYLPAISQELNGNILVLKKNFEKILHRPELKKYILNINYVDSYDELIKKSNSLVISVPPKIQEDYINDIFIKKYHYKNLILEKPIASNPVLTNDVLDLSIKMAESVRVGYSFSDTFWAKKFITSRNSFHGEPINISWKFNAHHFKNKIDSWKASHENGGGVIRFYGIQIIALLASINYPLDIIESNIWFTKNHGPFKWIAKFYLKDGATINIEVDAKSEDEKFYFSNSEEILNLKSPFDNYERNTVDDPRVPFLRNIIAADPLQNKEYYQLYYRVNDLLLSIESRTKWNLQN